MYQNENRSCEMRSACLSHFFAGEGGLFEDANVITLLLLPSPW